MAIATSAELLGAIRDAAQQGLERRNEMRFVENDQRIRTEQTGVIGPHPARDAVACEQQPRADHVDRADNDRRDRGIREPFPIINMSAAQCGNRKPRVVAGKTRFALPPISLLSLQKPFRLFRWLIDPREAANTMDKMARELDPA